MSDDPAAPFEWDETSIGTDGPDRGTLPPKPIHYRRPRRPLRPPTPLAVEAEELAAPAPVDLTPTEPPRPIDRLADAFPLMLVSGLCLVLAYTTHASGAVGGVNRLQVWVLFAALGTVAGVAAVVSYLISEPDAPEVIIMSESKQKPAKVRARRKTRMGVDSPPSVSPRRGTRSSPIATPSPEVRGSIRPDPAYLTAPLDEPEFVDTEPEFDGDGDLLGASEEEPTPRSGEQMIHEIDGLWADLERLRRFPRTSGTP